MPWIQAAIGSASDLASGAINYSGQRQANDQSGAGYSRGVSQLQGGQAGLLPQYNPWMTTGASANAEQLAGLRAGRLGGVSTPGDFKFTFNTSGPNADPSYLWRLNQGLKGVNASAAAGGGYFSGATGKALNDYAQGSASEEYGQEFNRYATGYGAQAGEFQNMFGNYSDIANRGLSATNAYTGANQSYDDALAQMLIAQGQNSAAGTLALYGGLADTNSSIASRWSGNSMFQGMQGGKGGSAYGMGAM
jgi:hypothetical protein